MSIVRFVVIALAALSFVAMPSFAGALEKDVQDKVDAKVAVIKQWAADPDLVAAVKAQNAEEPANVKEMTQDKWKSLTQIDPAVREFAKNKTGQFLKSKKDDAVSEAFLSAANGKKVAFIAKPSNFSHAGKAKYDKPMTGATWQGDVEVDESTGVQQVQVAVPVMDGDKAIGSLCVGLNIGKL